MLRMTRRSGGNERLLLSILDRYIFGAVLRAALLSLLVLVALQSLFVFLAEFDNLGDADYGVVAAAGYLLATMPERVIEVLPLAFLLGGLLGMGGLAHGSELVVMRASGRSVFRLVMAAMMPGVLLVGVGSWLGEAVAPELSQQANQQRAMARGKSLSILQGRGFWARSGDEFVHVNRISPDGHLEGVDLYRIDTDAMRLRGVSRAQTGIYRNGEWHLQSLTEVEMTDRGVIRRSSTEHIWNASISPRLLGVLALEPEMLSMRDLSLYAGYLESNGLGADAHRLAWWNKLVAPVGNLVMLFIAMPLVFGSLRSRGAGQRLFIGVILGLSYFLVNRTLSSVVLAYGFPPVLSAMAPPVLFFAVALFAMARIR